MGIDARCEELEPRFGASDFHRVWCTAEDSGLNPYRRLEFCGWQVAWGDAPLDTPVSVFPYQGTPYVATWLEVMIFLSTDGHIVAALELVPDQPRVFASSPPDLWTTFLDEHDDLDAAAAWLHAVRGLTNPSASWPVVDDVIARAHTALAPATSS